MNILIDNKEIKNFSKTNDVNRLSCREITQVHEGIVLIKTLENQTYIKENKGSIKKPIVEFNVLVGDTLHKNVRFVAEQTEDKSRLNFKKLGIVEQVKKAPIVVVKESPKVEQQTPIIETKAILPEPVLPELTPRVDVISNDLLFEKVRSGELNILLDSKSVPMFNKTDGVNTLICKEYTEVHSDIFLIKTHNNQTYLKDIKGKHNGAPVVEFKVLLGNNLHKGVKFVLERSEQFKNTLINFGDLSYAKFEHTAPRKVVPIVETVEELTPVEPVKELISPEPASSTPSLTPEQIKEQVAKALTEMLSGDDEISEKIAKLVNLQTESVRRDMMKYADRVSKREMFRAMESGGGTNAVQYVNGGTMNGNLTITGNISAANFTGGGGGSDLTKKAFSIGDGVNSEYTITHNYNSRNILIDVYDAVTNEKVDVLVTNDDPNFSVVHFSNPIGLNTYTVVTLG